MNYKMRKFELCLRMSLGILIMVFAFFALDFPWSIIGLAPFLSGLYEWRLNFVLAGKKEKNV